MNQTTTPGAARSAILWNRLRTFLSKPHNVILLLMGIVVTITTIAPIVAIVEDTFKIHPHHRCPSHRPDRRLYPGELHRPVHQHLGQDQPVDPPAEHHLSGRGHLLGVHPLRRSVRLPGHPHQSGLAEIPQLHLHLPYIMPQWTWLWCGRTCSTPTPSPAPPTACCATAASRCPCGGARVSFPAWWCWALHYAPSPISSSGASSATWTPTWRRQPPFWTPPSGRPCARSPCLW